jgi:hypothetical protein
VNESEEKYDRLVALQHAGQYLLSITTDVHIDKVWGGRRGGSVAVVLL